MPSHTIICLANSRKTGGRCVAGLRTDGRGWIRPVSSCVNGELLILHYTYEDGRQARVLDVVDIEFAEPKPSVYQPENWLIDDAFYWTLVRRPASKTELNLVLENITAGPLVFGDARDRVPLSTLQGTPIDQSLVLVEPEDVLWHKTTNIKGKTQIRTRFALGGVNYDLGVTDPIWEAKLGADDIALGDYRSAQLGIDDHQRILFTLSLGEPFKGDCYKLVAAAFALP